MAVYFARGVGGQSVLQSEKLSIIRLRGPCAMRPSLEARSGRPGPSDITTPAIRDSSVRSAMFVEMPAHRALLKLRQERHNAWKLQRQRNMPLLSLRFSGRVDYNMALLTELSRTDAGDDVRVEDNLHGLTRLRTRWTARLTAASSLAVISGSSRPASNNERTRAGVRPRRLRITIRPPE